MCCGRLSRRSCDGCIAVSSLNETRRTLAAPSFWSEAALATVAARLEYPESPAMLSSGICAASSSSFEDLFTATFAFAETLVSGKVFPRSSTSSQNAALGCLLIRDDMLEYMDERVEIALMTNAGVNFIKLSRYQNMAPS